LADALHDIQARGVLVVGVKKDVPLWGLQDPVTGEIQGLEPDLARRVAKDLGVKLKLVGVLTSERIQAVISGRVDLLIATLSDTPERREALTLVLPHYYASGVNLLARKSEGFKDWPDLRNRRVCGRRGAFYNRPITVTYGADIVALYGNALSFAALQDGRCSALLHDDTSIAALLRSPQWAQDFEMPMPTLYTVPWAMAISPHERGGALQQRLSDLVIGWHRQGVLAQLEADWGIPPSKYLRTMQSKWQQKNQGRWQCGDTLTESTPADCL
jgi:polar amino acid transport system substrate-binding protein